MPAERRQYHVQHQKVDSYHRPLDQRICLIIPSLHFYSTAKVQPEFASLVQR
jgi:hypothetical protein